MRRLLNLLFAAPAEPAARKCYIALVAAARNPFFFTDLGVPDTLDGRFELLCLHGFFLQNRLIASQPEFARQLSELLIADLDTNLRELGIGDSGVKRRIKTMAKAYHGRLQVYAAATQEGEEALKTALARNLYGTVPNGDVAVLTRMAAHINATQAHLANRSDAELMAGDVTWIAPA